MADVKIKGLDELRRALKELPKDVEKKCLRKSLVPGAQLIRDSAKELVLRRTGLVARAVRIGFNKKESVPGKAVYHVFVSMNVRAVGDQFAGSWKSLKKLRAAGAKGKSQTPFYWRFLEFGTSRMAARPFMRPAFDVSSQHAASLITNRLAAEIEKAAAALGRR